MSTKFTSGLYRIETTNIFRKPVFWDVEFDLPEEIRESMPLTESGKIHGIFLMGLYADPMIGDRLIHGGFEWEVTHRYHFPVARNKKGDRRISRAIAQFVGRIDNSTEL